MASGSEPTATRLPASIATPLCACEGVRIEAQVMGQFYIHLDQARGCYRCRVYPGIEALRQPRIRVFETKKDSIVGA